jgi:hypothetical protein
LSEAAGLVRGAGSSQIALTAQAFRIVFPMPWGERRSGMVAYDLEEAKALVSRRADTYRPSDTARTAALAALREAVIGLSNRTITIKALDKDDPDDPDDADGFTVSAKGVSINVLVLGHELYIVGASPVRENRLINSLEYDPMTERFEGPVNQKDATKRRSAVAVVVEQALAALDQRIQERAGR